MHLLELVDFIAEATESGSFAYVASLDIDGAFDKVPHHRLIESILAYGVEGYLVRYMARWLLGRTFRVRLTSVTGRFYSSVRGISRGVPRGGLYPP